MSADQIPAKLQERLEQITELNGYPWNLTVFLGKSFDPEKDTFPTVVISERDDEAVEAIKDQTPDTLRWSWPVSFIGFLNIDPDESEPLTKLIQFTDAIIRALYDPTPKGRTLDGTAVDMHPVRCKRLLPDSGSNFGTVLIDFEILYTEVYSE